jgi:hypothetical protein
MKERKKGEERKMKKVVNEKKWICAGTYFFNIKDR